MHALQVGCGAGRLCTVAAGRAFHTTCLHLCKPCRAVRKQFMTLMQQYTGKAWACPRVATKVCTTKGWQRKLPNLHGKRWQGAGARRCLHPSPYLADVTAQLALPLRVHHSSGLGMSSVSSRLWLLRFSTGQGHSCMKSHSGAANLGVLSCPPKAKNRVLLGAPIR